MTREREDTVDRRVELTFNTGSPRGHIHPKRHTGQQLNPSRGCIVGCAVGHLNILPRQGEGVINGDPQIKLTVD